MNHSKKKKNYNKQGRRKKCLISRVKKYRKNNSKKIGRVRKARKNNYTKKHKGGFGEPSCPFVTPPHAWNATGYSYFFPLSKNGVAVGGVPAFSGDELFQNGGNMKDLIPQSLLNGYRLTNNFGNNLFNRYQGLHLDPSVLPMFDQLPNPHNYPY